MNQTPTINDQIQGYRISLKHLKQHYRQQIRTRNTNPTEMPLWHLQETQNSIQLIESRIRDLYQQRHKNNHGSKQVRPTISS